MEALVGKSLVGMFVHRVTVISEKTLVQTGQIMGMAGPYLLIQFDTPNPRVPVQPHELVRADTLLIEHNDNTQWQLFDSRDQLEQWIEWCESAPDPDQELIESMERPRTH